LKTLRVQVLVIGSNADHCTIQAYALAYEVGRELARRNAILVTGGLGGVMEAASKGASEVGGLVVSIIPQDDKTSANRYSDVIISTGVGLSRDFITAYSADAIIVIGGGVGTTIETCVGYLKSKPIFTIKGSGGAADRLADIYLDDRKFVKVVGVDSPKEAVECALKTTDHL
jgi:uncharacterized protein (TIGR00725 family)